MGFGGMNNSGSSYSSRSVPSTLAEINVTPLVDVMLVLLVVFMISAPLMQQGVHVDLPKANAAAMDEVPDQIVLTVDKSRQILISDHLIPTGTLMKKLEAIVTAKPQVQVVIQADHVVPYGTIAQIMAEVKRAGINRVGLATQPGDSKLRL
jgi:biopolymer transport protein TolR